MSESLVLFSSDDEDTACHSEVKQYNNLKAMLKGVPPPSSITISKFTVEEMLQKYKENEGSYGFGLKSESCHSTTTEKDVTPWLNYSNSSHLSETIASLMQKVQERYVQMETMSSCNIWFNATLQSCGSAKKRARMRQGVGLSPGRRLSHLARRRQFFSSANLQRLADSNSVRQIEIKKNDHRDERQKANRTIAREKLNSSKRALFLSPENGTPTKYDNVVHIDKKLLSYHSDESRKFPLQENSKRFEVSKWLSQNNFETDLPRKRLREETGSQEKKRKCPRRSLNFGDDEITRQQSVVPSVGFNSCTDKKTAGSLGKLSQNHKNKLLWAVSVVLKENNISRSDDNFKAYASTLFHECRKNLDEILGLQIGNGTSDKILHYARDHISSIIHGTGHKTENIESRSPPISTQADVESRDDAKENVHENKRLHCERLRSTYCDNELEFVFKTPNKRPRKRKVKSCQKESDNEKRVLDRKWHSLESISECASLDGNGKNVDTVRSENEECKKCEAAEGSNIVTDAVLPSVATNLEPQMSVPHGNVQHFFELSSPVSFQVAVKNESYISSGSDPLPSNCGPYLMFSPVPSSVKEDFDSPSFPFNGLRTADGHPREMDFSKNVNNVDCDVDDNEIFDQDEEMKDKICSLPRDDELTLEYVSDSRQERPSPSDGMSINGPEENCCGVDGITSSKSAMFDISKCDSGRRVELCDTAEVVKSVMENILDNVAGQINEFNQTSANQESAREEERTVPENVLNQQQFSDGIFVTDKNEEDNADDISNAIPNRSPSRESEAAVGTYKPRKLVVKKSKPNWKVIRQNSEEEQNESDLKLKMRLSHEWEIVQSRNSLCSDVGNSSECEVNSVNCSQISSVNDERDFTSEFEQEDSDVHDYATSTPDDTRRGTDGFDCKNNFTMESQVPSNNPDTPEESGGVGTRVSRERSTTEENIVNRKIAEIEENIFSKPDAQRSSTPLQHSLQYQIEQDISRGSIHTCEKVVSPCILMKNVKEEIGGGPSELNLGKSQFEIVDSQKFERGMDATRNIAVSADNGEASSEAEEQNPQPAVGAAANEEDKICKSSKISMREKEFDNRTLEGSPSKFIHETSEPHGKEMLDRKYCSRPDVNRDHHEAESPILFGRNTFSKKRSAADVETEENLTVCDAAGDNRAPEEGCSSADLRSELTNGSFLYSEHKKKLLTLESYKARKLMDSRSSKCPSEESESKEMEQTASAQDRDEGVARKKIYNIRLKHPIGHHKHKHKERHRERKHRRESRMKEGSNGKKDVDDECSPVVSREIELCENRNEIPFASNHPSRERLVSVDDERSSSAKKSDGSNIQAIVDALSTLSDLVERQIKFENEKMASKRCREGQRRVDSTAADCDNEESTKPAWLDIVSSWCGKSLNNLMSKPETVSNSTEEGPRLGNRNLDPGHSQWKANNSRLERETDPCSAAAPSGVGPNAISGDFFDGSTANSTGNVPFNAGEVISQSTFSASTPGNRNRVKTKTFDPVAGRNRLCPSALSNEEANPFPDAESKNLDFFSKSADFTVPHTSGCNFNMIQSDATANASARDPSAVNFQCSRQSNTLLHGYSDGGILPGRAEFEEAKHSTAKYSGERREITYETYNESPTVTGRRSQSSQVEASKTKLHVDPRLNNNLKAFADEPPCAFYTRLAVGNQFYGEVSSGVPQTVPLSNGYLPDRKASPVLYPPSHPYADYLWQCNSDGRGWSYADAVREGYQNFYSCQMPNISYYYNNC